MNIDEYDTEGPLPAASVKKLKLAGTYYFETENHVIFDLDKRLSLHGLLYYSWHSSSNICS